MTLYLKSFFYVEDLKSMEENDIKGKNNYNFLNYKRSSSIVNNKKFLEDVKKLMAIFFSQKMIYYENRLKFRVEKKSLTFEKKILFEDGNIVQIKLKENSIEIEDIILSKWIKDALYIKDGILLNDLIISLNVDKIILISQEEKKIINVFNLDENYHQIKYNFKNVVGIKNDYNLKFLRISKDFQLNLISNSFPSRNEILFFEFSKRNSNLLYTLEKETEGACYCVYEMNENLNQNLNSIFTLKVKIPLDVEEEISLFSVSPSEKNILIFTQNNFLHLFTLPSLTEEETSKKELNRSKIRLNQVYFIQWHPLGYFFSVCYLNETDLKNDVKFFDLGLNIMKLLLSNGDESESLKLLLNNSMETQNFDIKAIEFLPQQDSHQIIFIKFKETFGLIKVEFSQFFNNENLNCLYFTSQLLKKNQPNQLFKFLLNCEKNSNFFQCLILLLNYLIKNERVEILKDIILNYTIYLKNKENNLYTNQFQSIIRKSFILFLLQKNFKISFQIANLYGVDDKKMFEDLYFYSKDNQVLSTSYLSFLKTNKSFQTNAQSLNLLLEKSELNKIEPYNHEDFTKEITSKILIEDEGNDEESNVSSVSLEEITIDILNMNVDRLKEQELEQNKRLEKIQNIFNTWK
eukprot:gene3072-5242_t